MSSLQAVPASPTVVWFRRDLRLLDNPALHAAILRGGPVIPIFIADEDGAIAGEKAGAASHWWLHHSLVSLDASLQKRGSRLLIARGEPASVLRDFAEKFQATAVYWNRLYEPALSTRDRAIEEEFSRDGVEIKTFNSSLLFEPSAIQNKQGKPFQVFTPYWRNCVARTIEPVVALSAGNFRAPAKWLRDSVNVSDLGLLPTVKWDAGFGEVWQPGEESAQKRLRRFMADAAGNYDEQRNFPAEAGTSRLSPHLHFGEIGPRQIWAAAAASSKSTGVFPSNRGVQTYLKEVGWREFAYHLLAHFPETPTRPLRREFEAFPWASDPGGKKLRAWQRGQTGYPIVDAGMRELWTTGWMHNRVRMIAASFLVKDLRLSWNAGAAWFWDTLVDANLANNTLGWQWSAGCGADAAPYFRIFSPILQGEKFDPDGKYVRRWIPEIAALPNALIHKPWLAPADALRRAGVTLGETYPSPIVDHGEARIAALAALKSIRKSA